MFKDFIEIRGLSAEKVQISLKFRNNYEMETGG